MERRFPGDFLSGVGGHAAHERDERRVRHAHPVVDRPAGPDRGEQRVVLGLVHVVHHTVVPPLIRPRDHRGAPGEDGADACRADDAVGVFGVAPVDGAAAEEPVDAAGVLIRDEAVVERAALARVRSSADGHGFERQPVVEPPRHLVGAVPAAQENCHVA